jgi:hypothetical protein
VALNIAVCKENGDITPANALDVVWVHIIERGGGVPY